MKLFQSKAVTAAFIGSSLMFAPAGNAQGSNEGSRFYAEVFGGLSLLSSTDLEGSTYESADFESGLAMGGAFGYELASSPFRVEAEFTYRSADAETLESGVEGDFASTTIAGNAYFDFNGPSDRLKPYIGAGLAWITEIDFDIEGENFSDEYTDRDVLGFQLMGGADFWLSETLSLNGELRYFNAGSQSLTGPNGEVLKTDYDTIDILIGARYNF